MSYVIGHRGAHKIVSCAAIFLVCLEPSVAMAQPQGTISTILASGETVFFVGVIALLTIYFGHIRFSRFSLVYGPEILTTVGIMGCFLGIAMALLNFDADNVQKSVPLLLQGVKTAFFASLAGVSGALYLRFLHHVRKPPKATDPALVKAASLDDVVTSMLALRQGLVGDEQGTLLTQMKLQRQESKDKLDELVREFKNFSTHMVENNQKAIIEALKQVISDFNENLTEQFGENFKQLNAAVENLVIWQQQYKEELEQIKAAQERAASDLGTAAERFGEFVNKAQQFADISEALRSQLELSKQHQETLFKQEKALAEVLTTMRDITPDMAKKVEVMLVDIGKGVQQLQGEISTLVKNLGVQVQSSNAEMKNLLSDVMTKSQKEVGEALKTHVATIKEGVITLDKALQKELNDSLETLGRQLASLSNKFVEDYTPLTDRLREVVQMAGRV